MAENNGQETLTCHLALMPSGRSGNVPRGSNLLRAAQELGVELESICGGRQTCGKCQIIVEDGHFPKHGITSRAAHLTPPSQQELEFFDGVNSGDRRLACAAEVLGDVLLLVPEESQARKQIIAKAASDRVIEIDPPLRQVYVEMQSAEMDDTGGDWERLQGALESQWGLLAVSMDSNLPASLQATLRQGEYAVTVNLWQDQEVLRVQPGYHEGLYGLAVDIGSTTVVAHLCDLRTGVVLSTQAAMNPQVRYGEDLMSRISYANSEPQGLSRMHRAIIRTLNEITEKACQDAGLSMQDILEAVVVCNPVMHHIFLGIHPRELGAAPFAPALSSALDLKARDLGLNFHPAARLHTLPLIAGHVGADNVAVLLSEAPQDQDEVTLLVDVGTNAEIVLGNRLRLLAASSPTGPAFEGAQITHGQRAARGAIERVRIDPHSGEPLLKVIGYDDWISPGTQLPSEHKITGICGSGIIEVVAELFLAGIIKSDGLFIEQAERFPRLHYRSRTGEYRLADASLTATGQPVTITQNDIRAIQLAKAALYAGTRLLMNHWGTEKVDRVVLAGAFGSFISPFHAMVLGLIPDCALDRVSAVGNAAGEGARIALLNRSLRHRATQLAHWVEHISTPLESSFQDEFVAALGLPHTRDSFQHLVEFLPKAPLQGSPMRRSRFRNRNTEAV